MADVGGVGGVNKTQDCRIYSNSQGYTPLGHLLVLLVFILSLVVIFGLMWYFVSIFSQHYYYLVFWNIFHQY